MAPKPDKQHCTWGTVKYCSKKKGVHSCRNVIEISLLYNKVIKCGLHSIHVSVFYLKTYAFSEREDRRLFFFFLSK